MSLTKIGFNQSADLTRNALMKQAKLLNKSQRALSTGRRINSAEDDSSGYALARGLENRFRSTTQAMQNMGMAENVMTVAASSYESINELLMDIKDLVMMGADASWSSVDREAIQGQINALLLEVDATVSETLFQGKALVDGSFVAQKFQVGGSAGDTFEVSLGDASTATILGGSTLDVSDSTVASASIAVIDSATQSVQNSMQRAGEYLLRLRLRLDGVMNRLTSIESTRSNIEDADFAQERIITTRSSLLREIGLQSLGDAISAPQVILSLFT